MKVNEFKIWILKLPSMLARLLTRRFRQIFFAAASACAIAFVSSGCVVYFFPLQTLCVESGAVKADVIVVLGGGPEDRPKRAAELFKREEAPKILVSGYGDCEENVQFLEKYGVPPNSITQEPNSVSTFENAEFSTPILHQMGAHHVIIVTSWFHARRALICFERFAPEMKFYSRPSYRGYPPTQSDRQRMDDYVKTEYVKLLIYWIYHGISPFYRA